MHKSERQSSSGSNTLSLVCYFVEIVVIAIIVEIVCCCLGTSHQSSVSELLSNMLPKIMFIFLFFNKPSCRSLLHPEVIYAIKQSLQKNREYQYK